MTDRTRSFRFLFALLLLKTVSQVLLYRHGLLSLSADEYARGIVAATWAANPRIDLLADLQAVWLPLEKYLNGLALIVWPDVILAPRLTVFLASCVTLVMFFLLTRRLFADFAIAALSTLLVALLPWFAWLSGTPMLEMYFFACFFAGLFFLVVWLQEERRAAWLWAGACFLLASGFHVQSWPLINLVNLLTLPFLWRFARQRAWRRALRLLGFYLLGNALILGFTLLEFALTGELFAFLSSHTAYSLWYYGGYDVPPLEKFLYYPRQIVDNAHAGYWLGLPIALLFLWRDPNRGWKLLPLALTAVSLLLFSSMNVLSGPPSAAPARYSLFYLMLLTPYLAYTATRLWRRRHPHTPTPPHPHTPSPPHPLTPTLLLPRLLTTLLLLYTLTWSILHVIDIPENQPWDAVAAGRALQPLLDENPGPYMVELHYWEFLAVNLAAHHFDQIVFDREQNLLDRTTPSIFSQDAATACEGLTAVSHLRYLALRTDTLKQRAAGIPLVTPIHQTGIWTLYRVNPTACPST